MTEKIWCLKPQYVNKFKCDGSKCGALCCRNDWRIYVDAKTYERYSALHDVIEHLRTEADDKYSITFNDKKVCPFLEDNLCRLQREHGEDYLSPVCASYPRITTRFDDFIELALSPTCPVAAEFLLADAPLTFEVVEADEKLLRLGANNILRGIPNDFAPLIFDVQLIMISILQERRLTINQRLIILGFLLDKLEELIASDRFNSASLENLATVYASESFMVKQVPLMLASVRFDTKAYESFMRKVTTELFGEPLIPCEKTSVNKFTVPIENFLVNEIILNVFPWRVNGGLIQNFAVFVMLYKVFERMLMSKGVQSVEEFLSVASDLSHKINHSDDFILQVAALNDADDLLTLMEKLLRV